MNSDYLVLASRRAETSRPPYRQPEEFRYDFRKWVSPYTKGANAQDGLAIVLQDWASADRLAGGPEPTVQEFGRFPNLLTNRRLEKILTEVYGLRLEQVYVTNAFPFIKPGGMSSAIPLKDMVWAVRRFCAPELVLARPSRIIALGTRTHLALTRAGVDCAKLPHPAARGMKLDDHVNAWREELR